MFLCLERRVCEGGEGMLAPLGGLCAVRNERESFHCQLERAVGVKRG